MIYNDIHALQWMSIQVRGCESPSLSLLVLSDGNPIRPVLLGSFSCVCCMEFVSKQCRLPYTFVEVQWPCRRLLGIIDIWESAAPSCSFPHYNTRYRWWLLGCWCVQWAFKIIQHTSRENCLPQVEIHYTVLKTIPYIKGTKCGKEKCNTVLLFLILRGKTVYPAQSIPLY